MSTKYEAILSQVDTNSISLMTSVLDSSSLTQSKINSESSLILQRLLGLLIFKNDSKPYDVEFFEHILGGDFLEIDESIALNMTNHDFWRSIGYPLLNKAAEAGLIDLVKVILKHAKNSDDLADTMVTVLLSACKHENLDVVKLLLEYGVDLHRRAKNTKLTCLYIASRLGNTALVRLLLEFGADPNLVWLDGDTPLFVAILYGWTEVVKLLLEHGAYANLTPQARSPPLVVACSNSRIDIASLLMEYGADIHVRDGETDDTILTFILQFPPCKKELVQLLIERGIDISMHNNHGYTALYYAEEGSEIAQLITTNAQSEPILK